MAARLRRQVPRTRRLTSRLVRLSCAALVSLTALRLGLSAEPLSLICPIPLGEQRQQPLTALRELSWLPVITRGKVPRRFSHLLHALFLPRFTQTPNAPPLSH